MSALLEFVIKVAALAVLGAVWGAALWQLRRWQTMELDAEREALQAERDELNRLRTLYLRGIARQQSHVVRLPRREAR